MAHFFRLASCLSREFSFSDRKKTLIICVCALLAYCAYIVPNFSNNQPSKEYIQEIEAVKALTHIHEHLSHIYEELNPKNSLFTAAAAA